MPRFTRELDARQPSLMAAMSCSSIQVRRSGRMMEPKGVLSQDRVHLATEGYRVWADLRRLPLSNSPPTPGN